MLLKQRLQSLEHQLATVTSARDQQADCLGKENAALQQQLQSLQRQLQTATNSGADEADALSKEATKLTQKLQYLEHQLHTVTALRDEECNALCKQNTMLKQKLQSLPHHMNTVASSRDEELGALCKENTLLKQKVYHLQSEHAHPLSLLAANAGHVNVSLYSCCDWLDVCLYWRTSSDRSRWHAHWVSLKYVRTHQVHLADASNLLDALQLPCLLPIITERDVQAMTPWR